MAQGLADAANKMVGSDVLTADHAGKLVAAGKDLLVAGMKQAPDATALEGDLKAYASTVVDKLKPYAEWGGVAGLAALGGKEAVLNYMRSAAVAVRPFVADYGRIGSYITRMAAAGNLTAVSIGVIVLMQADVQRGLGRAQNALKGGGQPLSETVEAPWGGYHVGDWVSVRYFEEGEKIDVAVVVAVPADGRVTVARLSTSRIEELPLRDVAFVAQDQYNVLAAREPELRGWVNMMLADQTVREASPQTFGNLPPAATPTLATAEENVCHARRRMMDREFGGGVQGCYYGARKPWEVGLRRLRGRADAGRGAQPQPETRRRRPVPGRPAPHLVPRLADGAGRGGGAEARRLCHAASVIRRGWIDLCVSHGDRVGRDGIVLRVS